MTHMRKDRINYWTHSAEGDHGSAGTAPPDPMGPMGPMLSPILDRDFVDRSTLMILIGHRGHRGHRVRNDHAEARAVTSWRCRFPPRAFSNCFNCNG